MKIKKKRRPKSARKAKSVRSKKSSKKPTKKTKNRRMRSASKSLEFGDLKKLQTTDFFNGSQSALVEYPIYAQYGTAACTTFHIAATAWRGLCD